MTNATRDRDIAELTQLLDAFGADPARWPDDAARRLGSLAETDATARRLVAEASAIDRLLAEADEARTTRVSSDLLDRIMAEVPAGRAESRSAGDGATGVTPMVISWPARSRARPATPAPAVRRDGLRAAALLAASLACGLYIGASAASSPMLLDVAERLGVEGAVDGGTLAFGEIGLGIEEDVL